MSLRPGEEPIPGYRLVERLGRGAFGEVWKATGPGRTEVALKFIPLSGKEGLKEFRAIERVKRIRHHHLTPITAIWFLDQDGDVLGDVPGNSVLPRASELVIAMGLGDKDLFKLLQEYQARGHAGIPLIELLDYVDDAARAIDYLNQSIHDLGSGPVAIQHCDIKPHNIMLVGQSAQVSDFGLARTLGPTMASRSHDLYSEEYCEVNLSGLSVDPPGYVVRLAPGLSRRRLEQQLGALPGREPRQRSAVGPDLQCRLSCRPRFVWRLGGHRSDGV